MSPPQSSDEPLVELRERLVRLEASASGHDLSSSERHQQLLAELRDLRGRVEHIETRLWRQAVLLAVVAVSGTAGTLEALKALLGGG